MSLLQRDERSGSETESGVAITATKNSTSSDSTNSETGEWAHLGKIIGRFVVMAPLGRGGMGDIYAARDQELDRTVALKFISSGSIGTAGVERVIREAKSASALNHLSVAAKKDTSLAVEKEPVVRLRYVRRQGQQIGKERFLSSLRLSFPRLWFDRRDRTCL